MEDGLRLLIRISFIIAFMHGMGILLVLGLRGSLLLRRRDIGTMLHHPEVVDHIEFFAGAGHGGVEPLVDIGFRHGGELTGDVDEDVVPLAALRLMTGEHIAEDGTEGVEIGVLHHCPVELQIDL